MITTEAYLDQSRPWPSAGRHILAQFDASTIIVYQAFSIDIAKPAARTGKFGDGFSLSRMSWIKPNFLWMMYRCGWGTKAGQEHVLAVRIPREKFETVLALAVPSTLDSARYASSDTWRAALVSSSVRLQWDPDRTPEGAP